MWLVQLHKAKEDASIGAVYVAESCERDYMANYIDPDEHTYELSLCNDWHYNNKKKLLILKKNTRYCTQYSKKRKNDRISV